MFKDQLKNCRQIYVCRNISINIRVKVLFYKCFKTNMFLISYDKI